MFILSRRDVEITQVPHPSIKENNISILSYQGQTFRLVSIFGNNREEALLFWRDLVDNKGKFCILLEEPESNRYSVWGKFVLDQSSIVTPPTQVTPAPSSSAQIPPKQNESSFINSTLTKGCLLILQAIYLEIGDLFGARQISSFKQDVLKILQRGKFAQVDSIEKLERWLSNRNLASISGVVWDESQLQFLLDELYKIAMSHFGSTILLDAARSAIADMSPDEETQFQNWLSQIPNGKFWQ